MGSSNNLWLRKLAGDQIVVIDGATGTELQKRGVPMDDIAWSGAAVISHPGTLRLVHEDYIRAGAEVLTANTFGSTRQMLEPAGYGDQVEAVNRGAVKVAIEARDNMSSPHVAVAGSISTMPPGFDHDAYLSRGAQLESYRESIAYMKDEGCDLIALEMMEETDHAACAMQAAIESGLPVWLGVSCQENDDGQVVGFVHKDVLLSDALDVLLPMGPTIVNVMHTHVHAVPKALDVIRQKWDGPIGVYPESGYFTRPNWNFVDIIPPEELAKEAARWIESGVRLLGGCCGTGPEHIKALHGLR